MNEEIQTLQRQVKELQEQIQLMFVALDSVVAQITQTQPPAIQENVCDIMSEVYVQLNIEGDNG